MQPPKKSPHQFSSELLTDVKALEGTDSHLRARQSDTLSSSMHTAPRRLNQGDMTIHKKFERQAALLPDGVAVIDAEDQIITFQNLNRKANALAKRLLGCCKPGMPVAICMPSSIELIISILAVLKAGCTYAPFDPTGPKTRNAEMMEAAGISVILGSPQEKLSLAPENYHYLPVLAGDIPSDEEQESFVSEDVSPLQTAYVIHTSGSTGKPKGVCCHHRGLLNLLSHFDEMKAIQLSARCSLWTAVTFDVSVYEIFSSLLAGGTLCLVPIGKRNLDRELLEWMKSRRIESAYLPPFMIPFLHEWVCIQGNSLSLRRLLVGVEPIEEYLLVEIKMALPSLCVINGYGPTETTICSTLYEVNASQKQRGSRTPIGKAVKNSTVRVLDDSLQPMGPNEEGELYISGAGLANGYLLCPALTAERFIPDPFSDVPGARMYRTGDIVTADENGILTFKCRRDQQMKINGFRIEAAEIEFALRAFKVVQDAAVVPIAFPDKCKRLAAFITLKENACTDAAALRKWLASSLPVHMLPSAFYLADAIPNTSHGKTDYHSLLANLTQYKYLPPPTNNEPPKTSLEQQVHDEWKKFLNIHELGVTDSLFHYGIQSIDIIVMKGCLEKILGRSLHASLFFEASDIRGFCRLLEEEQARNSNLKNKIQKRTSFILGSSSGSHENR